MVEELFQPQWYGLRESQQTRREILEEILDAQEPDQSASEIERRQAEAKRWRAIAGQSATFLEEVENALWVAEQTAVASQQKLHEATKPLQRGQRRSVSPTRAAQISDHVALLMWYAEFNDEKLSVREAVRQATTRIYAVDSKDQQLPAARLAELVEERLDENVKTYRKEQRSRKKKS